MGKIIQIEVPDWIDEELMIELRRYVNEKLRDVILLKKVEEFVDRLNLTEKDLKEFERTREDVWRKLEERYKKEGLI